MGLPSVGTIIDRMNEKTAEWEPRYVFLGSGGGRVFLLRRDGTIFSERTSLFSTLIGRKRLYRIHD